jgi:serine protease Do
VPVPANDFPLSWSLRMSIPARLTYLLLFAIHGSCAFSAVFAEPPEPGSPEQDTLAQTLYEASADSVVVISVADREGDQRGMGSGFVIDEEGLIATNLHVIGRSRPIVVQTKSGVELPVERIHAFDTSLDLAILKVKRPDPSLKAIALSERTQPAPGESIVVLGNPQGLKHSVVSGILSGTRRIDSRNMLQLAIPVEPGNSGGPVLNRQGEVIGIVTMKSNVTDNLGFAITVDHLKALLEQPNSVSLDQWLRIGSLDDSRWEPMFGGRWSQRGGRILVDQPGNGFGGRALCLVRQPPEKVPYEISVQVKLNELDGAAGIAFLGDGNFRHFGFYPTSGKVRVTKFDGPTVYQWEVLHEAASAKLRKLDWNHLKVRVEFDQFECFLNDELVFRAKYDAARYPGVSRYGLVKFRHSSAEFKQLDYGETVPDHAPPAERMEQVEEMLAALPSRKEVVDEQLSPLTDDAELARAILKGKAAQLKREAAELERLAEDVHLRRVLGRLSQELEQEEGDLLRGCLILAQLDDEQLELEPYLNQFEALAAQLSETVAEDASDQEKFAALDRFMFEQTGFHGSRTDYYERANSYLSRVIDDREGIPITLAVVYLELAQRLNLKAEGVGLPGHFLIRAQPKGEASYLVDCFEGGKKLSREDAETRVAEVRGAIPTDDDFLAVDRDSILSRILQNLMGIAEQANDLPSLLRYYEAMVRLDPDSPQLQGMRALLLHETGRNSQALAQLDWLDENMAAEIGVQRLAQMREYFQRGQ